VPPGDPSDTGALDRPDAGLEARVEALDAWLHEVDGQLRALDVAGDGKTLKELRRALEAWAKHDPKLEERVTNRVDVLADRVTTLAQTLNTTAAALAGKDGEIAALRRDLESGYARVQAASAPAGSVSAKEIAEIRASLAALSSERGSRRGNGKGDSRVDDLASRVEVLAGRVETLATTAATTASGLAGRDGEIAMLRRQVEEGLAALESKLGDFRTSVDPAQVQELRRAVKALSDETGGLKRDRQRLLDAVTSKFETVESKLDLVTSSAATAATGLAARELEIDELRASTQDATRTVATAVADLRESLATVSSQIAELDARETGSDAAGRVAERLSEVVGTVDALAGRVDALAAEIEGASTGDSVERHELETLQDGLEATRSHVDSVVADLREAIAALPTSSPTESANSVRLEELTRRIESLPDEIARLETDLASRESAERERLEGAVSALALGAEETARQLEQLGDRFAELEHGREREGAELATIAESWRAEGDALRAELESSLAALSGRVDELAQTADAGARLDELRARLEGVERLAGEAATEADRAKAERDAELRELREQLGALASARETDASRSSAEVERRVETLVERLEAVERDGVVVAAEIGRAAAFWATQIRELEGRLAQLASAGDRPAPDRSETDNLVADLMNRLRALEQEREDPVTAEPETAGLGELVERLEARLEASEQQLAELAASRAARLDELVDRVDSLERLGETAPSGPPSDAGRYRVELRGLELRMDHAEAAARENREAVLVQLERLASRLDWRLQQLESEPDERPEEPAEPVGPLGQVVPIHGEA
jgi:chromosome segregation ATPase